MTLPVPDLSKLKIDGLQLGYRETEFGVWLWAELRVPSNRCPGVLITISNRRLLSTQQAKSKAKVARAFRMLALQALAHEIEEQLSLDGERVLDPHPPGYEGSFALDPNPLEERRPV